LYRESSVESLSDLLWNALATLIDALADNKLDEDEKRALRHEYFKLAQLIHSALQELNK
jgi:hypothetical protein